ncbi:diacylglycerol kinase [Catenulispora sp. NF23]|uniref:Diacylglycerol kinase n=1 Tax=Catenulispora pinistramenti TaxID=2705254 RepID=A0ABS5KV27_9ACTN|nr:diacylglycerol kinase [Catenulispora pinistramenti]MBS2538133.1 diacylglycerol kinase [Catenulispora pinistramenti]MBS2549854.1 diacylglycerol kinase [Catenulispora pinistramenti]
MPSRSDQHRPDHLVVLINPTSAKGAGAKAGRRAVAALRAAGIDVTEIVGRTAADGEQRAGDALLKNPEAALVVVGGDGMVSAGLRLLTAEPECVLGIIPAGTGNDTARSLGIPLKDPEAAARVIVEGRVDRVDLGEATVGAGTSAEVVRRFSTVLACGLDSKVNDRANQMRWPRGKRRYDLSMLLELPRFKAPAFQMLLDDQERTAECMLIAVGNGPSYGGGMLICPQARMDDGRFQLTEVRKISKPALLTIFPKVFSGRHVNHPKVNVHHAARIELRADGVSCWADGERIGALPVALRTLPGALRVFRPAS